MLKYVVIVSLSFMAGAGLANRSEDPKKTLPTVCLSDAPSSPPGIGSDPSRCWTGTKYVYLMPGFEVVERMEGGTYLVGWPK